MVKPEPSEAELRRREAVRQALYRDKRWLKGAYFGNVSPAERRKKSQFGILTAASSTATRNAEKYIDAILKKFGKSQNLSKAPATERNRNP